MTSIRARVAAEPRYFPADPSKNLASAAYVRLAESTRRRTADGSWEDGPTRWYDAKFEGRFADVLHRDYLVGDALLVSGDIVKHEREDAEGKKHRSTKLYVDAFGPDALRARITLDRAPRASQQQDAAATIAQEAAASASPQTVPPQQTEAAAATVVAEARHVTLDGDVTDSYSVAAVEHATPVQPPASPAPPPASIDQRVAQWTRFAGPGM